MEIRPNGSRCCNLANIVEVKNGLALSHTLDATVLKSLKRCGYAMLTMQIAQCDRPSALTMQIVQFCKTGSTSIDTHL